MSESIYTPASGEVIDIVKDSAVYKLRDDSALRTDNLGFVEGVEGEDPTPGEGSIYKMTIGEEEHLIRDASAIHTTDTVTTSQIADGAVTEDKLGEDVTDQISALQDSITCGIIAPVEVQSGAWLDTAFYVPDNSYVAVASLVCPNGGVARPSLGLNPSGNKVGVLCQNTSDRTLSLGVRWVAVRTG